MANVYALGAVKPWVKAAANEVGNRFGVTTIYGVGQRDRQSDHPKGLALDFMVGNDLVKGDQIANFLQSNHDHYSVTYIIWKQRIWNVSRASEGWRAMPDRGGLTENHFDHIHVSFQNKSGSSWLNVVSPVTNLPGISNPLDPIQDVKASIDALKAAGEFVTDSHNWLRVGMFTLGGTLVLIALVMLVANGTGDKPVTVAKTVARQLKPKGVKNG